MAGPKSLQCRDPSMSCRSTDSVAQDLVQPETFDPAKRIAFVARLLSRFARSSDLHTEKNSKDPLDLLGTLQTVCLVGLALKKSSPKQSFCLPIEERKRESLQACACYRHTSPYGTISIASTTHGCCTENLACIGKFAIVGTSPLIASSCSTCMAYSTFILLLRTSRGPWFSIYCTYSV